MQCIGCGEYSVLVDAKFQVNYYPEPLEGYSGKGLRKPPPGTMGRPEARRRWVSGADFLTIENGKSQEKIFIS
jgi:hypothetical protein